MLFGSRAGRVDPRLAEWERFAAEYEMTAAAEVGQQLTARFTLGEGELLPVYSLKRPGQPLLVAFDQRRERKGPTGSVTSFMTGLALKGALNHGAPPMRASARRGRAVEALEASRSGAVRVEFPRNPEFDACVSVYARDASVARYALTPPVRVVLRRLLTGANGAVLNASNVNQESESLTVAPSVLLGESDLLLTLEPREPLPLTALGGLLADLLSLHVALTAGPGDLSQALLD